jgi:hypothetical protein
LFVNYIVSAEKRRLSYSPLHLIAKVEDKKLRRPQKEIALH